MSTPAATRSRPAPPRRRTSARAGAPSAGAGIVALLVVAGVAAARRDRPAAAAGRRRCSELALPLRHEDIIRQQAADKDLDPSLVAGVIYAESHFRDADVARRRARAHADHARRPRTTSRSKSGGTAFEQGDLATPQINISYGAYYLRYLLDRYDDNEVLALAAYNGGEGNVDRWLARQAHAADTAFDARSAIPFAETREYVKRVLDAQRRLPQAVPRASSGSSVRWLHHGIGWSPTLVIRTVPRLGAPSGPAVTTDTMCVLKFMTNELCVPSAKSQTSMIWLWPTGQRDVAGARRRLAHDGPSSGTAVKVPSAW